jgi:predicted acyl esterase
VWPPEDANKPELGGYQWMISADVLRGRYRNDPAHPSPVVPGSVEHYELPLPNVSHTFKPGHRIMVQIQSSWFPLYDRNPQKYVPNIMLAKPQDYVSARHRVFHAIGKASFIDMPVVSVAKP